MSAWVKLLCGASIIAAVTSYMAYVGASSSWQYYVTTDECLAQLDRFRGCRLRVSGAVAEGTLRIDQTRRRATFELQGESGNLRVSSFGRLPDNLEECVEVVVEGQLDSGGALRGDKILTKCAGKYRRADDEQSASGASAAQEGES